MKIEQLEKYAELKMEVRMNEDRLDEVFNETLFPGMKQGDGSQRTPGKGDKQEKANIRYIELKDRLQPIIDANKAKMRQIEDAINSLPDPQEREILRLRFTDTTGWKPLKWRLVALKMYGDDGENELAAARRAFVRARASIESLP